MFRVGAVLVVLLLAACGEGGSNALDGARRYPDAAIARDGGRTRRDAGSDVGVRPDFGVVVIRDGGGDGGRESFRFSEDIEPILAKCDECHGDPPRVDAVRSLLSYDDLHAVNVVGQPIHELVVYRIYRADWNNHLRGSEEALTDAEKALLRAWSEGGAEE